jgi:soluble lytic murein transglycosylase-like protein
MAGGPSALLASVLGAANASDALRRVAYVQRLVGSGDAGATASGDRTLTLRARATALQAAAVASTTTVADVQRRYDELTAALAAATDDLARLSTRARGLEEAAAAAAKVAALNAAVAAAASARVSGAHASDVMPESYRTLYVAAARTCQGMSWTLLAAIGQVESGHGANTSSSYAGAQGPMQFLPSTFGSYAVDGDKDGRTDIQDPADAIFTAARYLCANGAGRDASATARAVWHYNHADWYVALVLKLAGQYAERAAA